jgi:hypothetical protein
VNNRLEPLSSIRDTEALARAIEERLACPRCHDAVTVRAAEIRCSRNGYRFTGAMAHGAVSASESAPADLTA